VEDAMKPRVSIITLNLNQAPVTEALLKSLARSSGPSFEVLVVDNNSRAGEAARLEAWNDPRVRVIRNGFNAGFTGGNNRGIAEAQGEFVLLLNNDTEVEPDCMQHLVDAFDNDQGLGLASPKIRFHHSPDVLQYAGGRAINPYTGRGSLVGFGERDQGQHDQAGRTHFAHGAAMMIRREVLDRVGLLHDEFFIYYEELDFAERAHRAGIGIGYVPTAVIYHKESLTTGRSSPFKTFYMTRNRILFLRRNVTLPRLAIALAFFGIVSVPTNLFRFVIRRQWDLLRAFTRGIWWHIDPARTSEPPALVSPRPAQSVL